MSRTVFVTVGTTKFDDLVKAITTCGVLDVLVEKGYTKLLIQTGRGTYSVDNVLETDIIVETYDYKKSIRGDIEDAALVVSHAGAGRQCFIIWGIPLFSPPLPQNNCVNSALLDMILPCRCQSG